MVNWLPRLYQRFQPLWDRAVPAGGLALLLWASAQATGAFAPEWRVFLTLALFVLGLFSSQAAYVAFTFLISYPLYSISIYLAALVLAALILSSPWAANNLGATVLVLITPLLLSWRVEATIPLLLGLWWGELAGVVGGALAALWLKLLAGMSGQPLDLALLNGQAPASAEIIERFSGFNSLQTLVELVNPFADTSQALLLHLLQILAWALAGYVAGALARRVWSDRWRGWSPLLSAVAAAGALWLGYGLLPGLVHRRALDFSAWPDDVWPWLLASALLAATLRQFYVYLRRPLVARPSRRPAAQQRAAQLPQIRAVPRQEQAPDAPKAQPSFNWTPAKRKPETDDDIIMLEID
jgi:hypothetical protein